MACHEVSEYRVGRALPDSGITQRVAVADLAGATSHRNLSAVKCPAWTGAAGQLGLALCGDAVVDDQFHLTAADVELAGYRPLAVTVTLQRTYSPLQRRERGHWRRSGAGRR